MGLKRIFVSSITILTLGIYNISFCSGMDNKKNNDKISVSDLNGNTFDIDRNQRSFHCSECKSDNTYKDTPFVILCGEQAFCKDKKNKKFVAIKPDFMNHCLCLSCAKKIMGLKSGKVSFVCLDCKDENKKVSGGKEKFYIIYISKYSKESNSFINELNDNITKPKLSSYRTTNSSQSGLMDRLSPSDRRVILSISM